MPTSKTYQIKNGLAKVQIEDLLGRNPSGGWKYQGPGQGNNNAEGAHYYYKSQTAQGSMKTVPSFGRFSFKVNVEDPGHYSILLRAARDTNKPGDARNDIWIKVDGNTQSVMPKGTPQLTSGGQGFVKFKGAQTHWINAHMFSTSKHGDKNPASTVVFDKGIHTITFAPRSTGFHIDSVKVVKKSGTKSAAAEDTKIAAATQADDKKAAPALDKDTAKDTDSKATAKDTTKDTGAKAAVKDTTKDTTKDTGAKVAATDTAKGDSDKHAAGDKSEVKGVGNDKATITSEIAAKHDDFESNKAAASKDLEFGRDSEKQSVGLRFKGMEVDKDAEIKSAYFVFHAAETSKGAAHFQIEVEDTTSAKTYSRADAPDDRAYLAEDVDWHVQAWKEGGTYKSADISDLIKEVIEEDGLDALDALAFRISGEGERVAHAFESNGHAPELVINYDLA